ncbi:ankyrin repeat domain-containing protein 27-like [Penaeus monodon]|uniref:ankyrin repeat domain-containing protein 27-like n=1 Tax=Penaeus monodon TaxID=6687 RepID=UPI0018A760D4|nr:ankyrin repeat domain-containing protein 27-like [Penaeus monodon]
MSFKIAELLVFKGASVKTANRAKRTALHLAAEKGNDEILTLLVSNCPESVHAREAEQQTPLHLAARCGHVTSCRLLVGNGADKGKQRPARVHCSALGCQNGFFQSVVVSCSSLDLRASPAIQNNKGETPFHCAQYSPGEVRKLFEAHPDIDLFIADNKGKTVLHCAAERKKAEC